ncbi:MAG: bifunctional chorismate mutase/prephenate dehydratase [Acidobacteria bacterium]|nr:bifunctional chorismate mutase/prephenate dehydratase [Acidobacteriota bacterium]
MDLEEVRRQIDRIDFEVLSQLNRRMELALTSRKFKNKVLDKEREHDVLQKATAYAHGQVSPEFSRKLLSLIMEESRRLQETNRPLLGFQGEHGANSETAALRFTENAAIIPMESFADIFDGVEAGYLDFGIVPVENSLGGMVSRVNELMATRNVYVVGEELLPVHHFLLALPETDYRDIRVVVSHPQALAQCREFLTRHKLEGRPYYDTAGAAEMLFRDRPGGTAVIAGESCAKLYHLSVIKEHIEDHSDNITRFLVISGKASKAAGNKCSVVFSTPHKAGALFEILETFAREGLNLTRIESVHMGGHPGNYVFFLDFLGSDRDESVRQVLEKVKAKTGNFRFLGCYKRGQRP